MAGRLTLARLDACFDDAGFLRHVPAVIARLDAIDPALRPRCREDAVPEDAPTGAGHARGSPRMRPRGPASVRGRCRVLRAEARFLRSGKVRDLYDLDDGRLLLVASDRISAFDVVLPTPIPDKGRVLTGLSRFWFRETAGIVPNHLLASDPAALPRELVGDPEVVAELRGRMMVVPRAGVLPVECVVRGYLAGSGWKEYRATGEVCGIELPPGLRESDRLPEPIFTPSTKAPAGVHDENIPFDASSRSSATSWPSGSGRPRSPSTRTARRSASGPGSSSPTRSSSSGSTRGAASCSSSTRC